MQRLSFVFGLQSHFDFALEVFKMDQLFQSAQLISLDLIESQETFSTPSWQFDGLDFLAGKAVFGFIFFDMNFSFFFVGIVAGVDDEVVLAGDACLTHVVFEHFFHSKVQTHEVSQGLLPQQSLSLHVNLPDGLPSKTLGLDYLLPFANAKLHEGEFEDVNFFWLPAWRKGIVPQTLGLVVFDTLRHAAIYNRNRRANRGIMDL